MMRTQSLPDYSGGGILGLMQSIATACGSPHKTYPPLNLLPANQLARARHIVLMVVDGLGERILRRHGPSPHLQQYLIGSLSSVFPSTTASAIPTFLTGLAPAQHGLTGWHMHLSEVGQTLAILPLLPRVGPPIVPPRNLPDRLFDHPTVFESLDRECWAVAPQSIAHSPFNTRHTRGAQIVAYDTLPEMFGQLAELLASPRPRYIYAYFPDFDSLSHHYGTGSRQALQVLAQFDALFARLVDRMRGSRSWLLVTADHGFIDSPSRRVVSLDDHPALAELLLRPLCGERRVSYCYVAPENRPAFETYVRRRLSRAVHLYDSRQLIAASWFGPPPCHPRLAERIGDYTLVCKGNWTIKDWLPGERHYAMLGVHGGISDNEMRVPLSAVFI